MCINHKVNNYQNVSRLNCWKFGWFSLFSKQTVCQIPVSFFHNFIIFHQNLTKAFFFGKWFWIIKFLVSWPSYLPHKFFGKDFRSLSCPGLNGRGETSCWNVPNIWFGIIEEHQINYYCWHFIIVLHISACTFGINLTKDMSRILF